METFDGYVQVDRYDAEGLRHELEEDGKLAICEEMGVKFPVHRVATNPFCKCENTL